MTTSRWMSTGAALVSLLGSLADADEASTIPLKPDLPKPLLVGTPFPLPRVPNLETPAEAVPAPLMVPRATVNLASNRTVTSSETLPLIGELRQITDGDKETAETSVVELGNGRQWVQIDLDTPARIHAIAIWRLHSNLRVYHDVSVKVSSDVSFTTNVTTVFNNDHDNSSGDGIGMDKAYVETFRGKIVDAKGVLARYVRVYSKGSTAGEMNHYAEVEVYGMRGDVGRGTPALLKPEPAKRIMAD